MTKFLSLLIVAASLLAQTTPAVTGLVSGRVVDADTRMPVAGAKVGSSMLGWTLTDDDGRYTIHNIAPGFVSIGMDYAGGANLDDIPVIPRNVTIIGGRETTGVDFKVWLDGSISGHVFDSNNEPLPGIRVTLFYQSYRADMNQSVFNNSDILLNSSAGSLTVITNDRGAYSARSPFLRAGRSTWVLAERERVYGNPISDAPADVESRRKLLIPTYYPNAASLADATPIVLHSLEHRDNVDIHMSSSPSYCMDATLKTAGTPARINYALEEEPTSSLHSGTGIPRKGGEYGDDGKIRACDLHSGRYQLTAFGRGLPNLVDFFGTTTLTIANADVHNVIVTAEPSVKLPVELAWDKTPPAASAPVSLRVNSIPSFRSGLTPSPSAAVPGEILLTVLPSLRQSIEVSGLAPPFYVKDIALDGRSVLHQSFDPGTGSSRLRIIIGRDSGSIQVQVGGSGTAVMIIPESVTSDAELAHVLVAGTTDDNGKYVATQIPPGKYYVLATNDPPSSRILHPANLYIDRTPENLRFLLRARAEGQLVEVMPGGTTSVHLVPKDFR